MDYFPAFINVRGKDVRVIGGNEDALHKVRLLLKTSARIIIHGDVTAPTLRDWIAAGDIHHCPADVTADDLAQTVFAYIAVEDTAIRDAAMHLFERFRLPYSVIDDKARSSFITPALVDRDPVVIAIGTEGTGPIIARDIKARIERELHPLTGMVAKVAGLFRPKVAHLPHGAPRRYFWQRYLDEVVPPILASQPDDVERHLNAGLDHLLTIAESQPQQKSKPIRIINIAAGSADMLTRQALRLLHDADLIIHDRGAPHDIVELTRREARKEIYCIHPSKPEDSLSHGQTASMLKAAHDGQSVVVLVGHGSMPFKEALVYSTGLTLEHAAHVIPATHVIPASHDEFSPHSHQAPHVVRPWFRRAS